MDWVGNFQNSGSFPDYLNPAPKPRFPQPRTVVDLTNEPIDLTSDTECAPPPPKKGKYDSDIGTRLAKIGSEMRFILETTGEEGPKVQSLAREAVTILAVHFPNYLTASSPATAAFVKRVMPNSGGQLDILSLIGTLYELLDPEG